MLGVKRFQKYVVSQTFSYLEDVLFGQLSLAICERLGEQWLDLYYW